MDWWKLFGGTFVLIFLAELGDKTQLAAMARVADGPSGGSTKWAVFLAASSALVLSTLIAVFFGGVLRTLVPDERHIRIAAGCIFLVFGILMLASAARSYMNPGKTEDASARGGSAMEFRRLDSARDPLFTEAFALYETSFPEHEQRLLDEQKALMATPPYHFTALLENDAFVGILLYWEGSGYVYVEHFAIQPSMRGKALGSGILKAFCRDHSRVVLEIDPPVDPVSVRREGFYHRLGFRSNNHPHTHPAYRKQFPPHELVVMSYPDLLTTDEYRLFQRELREVVMKDINQHP